MLAKEDCESSHPESKENGIRALKKEGKKQDGTAHANDNFCEL